MAEQIEAPRPIARAYQVRGEQVPRIFQVILVIYVLVTGEIPQALQAVLFGLTGGGEAEFTLAVLSAVAIDIIRLAPVFMLARHPLGILHPLIIAVVLWPILVAMPGKIEEFGGLGGLFLGTPVSAPFYLGLGWRPAGDVWSATAFYNMLEVLGLISIYAGFAIARGTPHPTRSPQRYFETADLRRLSIVLIGLSVVMLFILISFRGGVNAHLADLARGRFRSLAGFGPILAVVDFGVIAMLLWVAARPQDARKLIFLGALGAVAAAQFISNGSRSATLLLFMMVGLVWSLRTRRIPWRLAIVMAPLIFLALGFLNIIRTSAWAGQTATEAIMAAEASSVLTQVQEEIEVRRSVNSPIPIVADGFRVMDGPLLGRSYLAAIFAWVPRYWWEDKPRGPGSLYAQHFLGDVREGMAVPVGPTAEAHWNFGVIGVILVFFLHGLLLRKAHDLYLANQENPFVVTFFVLFVTSFRPVTDELVPFMQQLGLLALTYVLARFAVRQVALPAPPTAVAQARVAAGGE